jgi:hypothetical protein
MTGNGGSDEFRTTACCPSLRDNHALTARLQALPWLCPTRTLRLEQSKEQ